MFVEFLRFFLYFLIFSSLFVLDYSLGSGFLEIFHVLFCKVVCVVRKLFRKDGKFYQYIQDTQHQPVSFFTLLTEVVLLGCTVAFLKKYRSYRGKDRIDELLQESKEALRQTNEFLEKWRMRRLPADCPYLDDEELQDFKPLQLEIPILHMAIIDTLSTARTMPERGDAGDSINYTDSAILSMAPLLDEIESNPDTIPLIDDKFFQEKKTGEIKSRYLYDVEEEDSNTEDLW